MMSCEDTPPNRPTLAHKLPCTFMSSTHPHQLAASDMACRLRTHVKDVMVIPTEVEGDGCQGCCKLWGREVLSIVACSGFRDTHTQLLCQHTHTHTVSTHTHCVNTHARMLAVSAMQRTCVNTQTDPWKPCCLQLLLLASTRGSRHPPALAMVA
jgi:hypothetical protein